MRRQGSVVKLSPQEKAVLKENLSTLLACLRIRFQAVQYTKFELVTDEDIDHFEICRRLSQYCNPDT